MRNRLLPNRPVPTVVDSRPVVLAYLNAYTAGMSGGDVWFIEIARRTSHVRWIVVTSEGGASACRRRGLDVEYIITSDEVEINGLVRTYLARTIKGIWHTRHLRPDIVEATSDAPPDVLPALWHRLVRQRKGVNTSTLDPSIYRFEEYPSRARWVQRVFHIVPRRRGRMVAHAVQWFDHVIIAALADSIVVDSEILRRDLVGRGIGRDRITVSKPGVTALQMGKGAELAPAHALYLGRLVPSKGVLELPAIWARVVESIPDARLFIAGYGSDSIVRRIREQTAAAGLSNHVTVLGFVRDTDLCAIYNQARIFVFPSHEEGFGMAVLDALSLGLPVVAWRIPALEENFADAVDMVQEGDSEAFARRAISLLSNDDRWSQRREDARRCAARYEWSATAAAEYAEVLAPLLDHRTLSRPRTIRKLTGIPQNLTGQTTPPGKRLW